MKKLGLCVRYDCNNYGSMLQIYATQKIIHSYDWDYDIIRYDKKEISFYIKNLSRLLNPYFMKGKITRFKKKLFLKKYPDVDKNNKNRLLEFQKYRESYIGPFTETIHKYKDLMEFSKKYDAVMVGSDQLWTPAGIKSKFYNLLFVPDNVRKISFATSFGVNNIPENQKLLTTEYLSRIDYLSTRELNGKRIISDLTGRKASVVLDPTLMYDAANWNVFFDNKKVINEPYIFAYYLGDNLTYRDKVEEFSKMKGLKVVTCPFMDCFVKRDITFGDEALYDIGPDDFLNLIRNAEYICTDSFHGTVFSILYHKQFITFNRTNSSDKQTRNSRIDSLFSLLGIEDRRYRGGTIISQIDNIIDYDAVDSKLKNLRELSKAFLAEALG